MIFLPAAAALVCILCAPVLAMAQIQKWNLTSTFEEGQSSPLLLGPDGTLYVVMGSGYTLPLGSCRIYAIATVGNGSIAAGSLKWIYQIEVPALTYGLVLSTPVLGPDGTLYVGSIDTNIYAIVTVGSSSVAAGSLKWRYATGGPVYSSPVLGPDGTMYVGSDDGYVYAIITVGSSSVAAGSLKWRYATGNSIRSTPVLGPDGTLYVGSDRSSVYAIVTVGSSSIPAGSLKWKYQTEATGRGNVLAAPLLGPDGTLYVASAYNSLYAVSAIVTVGSSSVAAGSLKWKYQMSNSNGQSAFALSPDGSLFFGGANIYAIDTVGNSSVAAGSLKWCYEVVNATIYLQGLCLPVLGPDGTLYAAASDAMLAIVTVDSSSVAAGSLKWRYSADVVGTQFLSSVLGPDGTLYASLRYEGIISIHALLTGVNCACSAGTFLNSSSFTSCSALASVCPPCPIASYCPNVREYGFTSAVPCPIGYVCETSGMTAPTPCPPGSYCPSVSMSMPTPCDVGGYCPNIGMTAVSSCVPGSYCPNRGMLNPIPCTLGHYCPSSGMSAPTPCPEGFFQPTAGASTLGACQACLSGNFCPRASVRSIPCPPGSFYSQFNATQPSDCLLCPANSFASSGASLCSKCGSEQTSSEGATTCDPCVPSAFSITSFKCYSLVAQVLVVCGYVVSMFSFLFSCYKLRIFIRERVLKLKAAGIKPTLKRIVCLERALTNHSKRMLLSHAEQAGGASIIMDETRPTNDATVVRLVRDLQAQMQQQQQQIQDLQTQLRQLQSPLQQH